MLLLVKTLVIFSFFCYNILNIALSKWGGKMSRKKIPVKVGDVIVSLLVLAVAAAIFFLSLGDGKASRVVVTVDGEESVYSLFEEREIEVSSNGCELKIVISNGAVRVTESSCPDKVCASSGKISSPGRVIACVPAGVTVKVEGEIDDEIDWIAP